MKLYKVNTVDVNNYLKYNLNVVLETKNIIVVNKCFVKIIIFILRIFI